MKRLAGRTALVTGSTGGLGVAIASALAEEGAFVVVSGRDKARGDAVVADIRAAGGTAEFVVADLGAGEQEVRRLAEQATAVAGGRIDILVNNAAMLLMPTPTAEIRDRGVAVATLDDIRARTQTSKSQLFHYFPDGKEQLLLAVAEHEAQMVLDDQQPYLGELTSWAAWQRWRDAVVDRYRRQGQHCPLAVLMSEIGRSTPGAQAVTSALMRKWHVEIAAGVRHMQAQDKVAARLDADKVAAALLAGIQGGVGVMLATGDLSYLEAALDVAIESLRAAD